MRSDAPCIALSILVELLGTALDARTHGDTHHDCMCVKQTGHHVNSSVSSPASKLPRACDVVMCHVHIFCPSCYSSKTPKQDRPGKLSNDGKRRLTSADFRSGCLGLALNPQAHPSAPSESDCLHVACRQIAKLSYVIGVCSKPKPAHERRTGMMNRLL